jgi:hypothetical protein
MNRQRHADRDRSRQFLSRPRGDGRSQMSPTVQIARRGRLQHHRPPPPNRLRAAFQKLRCRFSYSHARRHRFRVRFRTESARLRGAHTEVVGHTPSWPQFWCFAVIAALLYQSPEAGSSWAAAVCAFAQVSKRATNAVKSSVRGPEPPPRCSRFRCRSRCSIRQPLPRPRLGRLRVSARRRAVPRYRR